MQQSIKNLTRLMVNSYTVNDILMLSKGYILSRKKNYQYFGTYTESTK